LVKQILNTTGSYNFKAK